LHSKTLENFHDEGVNELRRKRLGLSLRQTKETRGTLEDNRGPSSNTSQGCYQLRQLIPSSLETAVTEVTVGF
jgi:hypothetical protein